MDRFLYLAAGIVLGLIIGAWVTRLILKKKQQPGHDPVTNENGVPTCQQCNTAILGDPIHVVLMEKGSFKYYRCLQCGTNVTVPLY